MCIVSNFERLGEPVRGGSRNEFEITGQLEIPPDSRTGEAPAVVLLGGNHSVVAKLDADGLVALLEADAPTEALVGKAVDIVRETARRPEAGGTIGEDLLVAVVPRNPDEPALLSSQSAGAAYVLTSPNIAHLAGEDDWWVARDTEFRAETPGVKLVPRVGRNERCPCGSGKRFKQCHGKA